MVHRESASFFETVMTGLIVCIVLLTITMSRGLYADPNPTPTSDKSQYTLFDPTPIDLRRSYNTDRPSKTDSPYTIDAGVFQIESDVWNWTLDYEKGVRTRTWILSNSNFKLGLTNWMDFYDAISAGPWVGTLDTGLIYQVTPNCSIDVNSFFGLTRSSPDYNLFSGFGYRF